MFFCFVKNKQNKNKPILYLERLTLTLQIAVLVYQHTIHVLFFSKLTETTNEYSLQKFSFFCGFLRVFPKTSSVSRTIHFLHFMFFCITAVPSPLPIQNDNWLPSICGTSTKKLEGKKKNLWYKGIELKNRLWI